MKTTTKTLPGWLAVSFLSVHAAETDWNVTQTFQSSAPGDTLV